MTTGSPLRFVTKAEAQAEQIPWASLEWLSRPGLTDAQQLLLIRARFKPGQAHQFHRHPHQEEIIYVEEGEVEQWVDREHRTLHKGELVHIPTNVVHGSYNHSSKDLVVLAILSPAQITGPALIDVHNEEPWRSLKAG